MPSASPSYVVAVELGVQFIDTAEGSKRLRPAAWPPLGRPEYLRHQELLSMRRLGVDQIDLFQLHRIDPLVPLADQVGEFANLREEGKIVSVGLSQVTVDQLEQARSIVEIASVQSRYNIGDRDTQDVLDVCSRDKITFIPWVPMAQGRLDADSGVLADIARAHDVEVGPIALAWLLAVSEVMVPIPVPLAVTIWRSSRRPPSSSSTSRSAPCPPRPRVDLTWN